MEDAVAGIHPGLARQMYYNKKQLESYQYHTLLGTRLVQLSYQLELARHVLLLKTFKDVTLNYAFIGPVDLLGTEFAFAVVFVYNLFENCQYGH